MSLSPLSVVDTDKGGGDGGKTFLGERGKGEGKDSGRRWLQRSVADIALACCRYRQGQWRQEGKGFGRREERRKEEGREGGQVCLINDKGEGVELCWSLLGM